MKNLVPLPYRGVSVQPYDGEMSEAAIRQHLLGREAYRRTNYIILRKGDETAVVAVDGRDREPLFSPIETVDVLALPPKTAFVESPEIDTANASALAAKAHELGIGPEETLVVLGEYEHVNFIHHPDPLVVRVVEVVPPDPPKLYGVARHVLSYAVLPPIRLELETVDLRELASGEAPEAFLVPCRSGGLDELKAPVFFLDQRPERRSWTLIGCERSRQFHRHFYGDEPRGIEMCPRRLAGRRDTPTLVKCCFLEFAEELDGEVAVVPWGAELPMVERALRRLTERHAISRKEASSLP